MGTGACSVTPAVLHKVPPYGLKIIEVAYQSTRGHVDQLGETLRTLANGAGDIGFYVPSASSFLCRSRGQSWDVGSNDQ